jgi:DnaJ-class molecular chaperone
VQYTHYDYLDLAPGATRAAVDAAYARRLEQLGYGNGAAGSEPELLRRVHAAYEVLADPLARKAYDAQLAHEAALADAELKAALDSIAAARQRQHEADWARAQSTADDEGTALAA